jgi:uroporphyrinogen decarboxylase
MPWRERVLATLNFQQPDRVRLDLRQAAHGGIAAGAYQSLLTYLGFPSCPIRIGSKLAQTVLIDEDVLQRFHIDFQRLDLGTPDNRVDQPVGEDGCVDEWGVVRTRPKGGYYYDLTGSPFAQKDTVVDIDRYPWPDCMTLAGFGDCVNEPLNYLFSCYEYHGESLAAVEA